MAAVMSASTPAGGRCGMCGLPVEVLVARRLVAPPSGRSSRSPPWPPRPRRTARRAPRSTGAGPGRRAAGRRRRRGLGRPGRGVGRAELRAVGGGQGEDAAFGDLTAHAAAPGGRLSWSWHMIDSLSSALFDTLSSGAHDGPTGRGGSAGRAYGSPAAGSQRTPSAVTVNAGRPHSGPHGVSTGRTHGRSRRFDSDRDNDRDTEHFRPGSLAARTAHPAAGRTAAQPSRPAAEGSAPARCLARAAPGHRGHPGDGAVRHGGTGGQRVGGPLRHVRGRLHVALVRRRPGRDG